MSISETRTHVSTFPLSSIGMSERHISGKRHSINILTSPVKNLADSKDVFRNETSQQLNRNCPSKTRR
jgi:hypothetical protein